jgi:hypothetical protein
MLMNVLVKRPTTDTPAATSSDTISVDMMARLAEIAAWRQPSLMRS